MDDKQRKKHEEFYDLGIFMPLRTCPQKNGIGIDEDEGKTENNWCHDGCAWAVKGDSSVHEDGITAHRGYCGANPFGMKQE